MIRKPQIISLVAAFALAAVSIGSADSAMAQDRASEPAEATSELAESSPVLLISAIVLAILGAIIAIDDGEEEVPVSP